MSNKVTLRDLVKALRDSFIETHYPKDTRGVEYRCKACGGTGWYNDGADQGLVHDSDCFVTLADKWLEEEEEE